MGKRIRDILFAACAIGVAVASLYFAFGRPEQKIDLGPYAVLGTVTAEEAARIAGGQGEVMVVVRDTGPDKNPSVEAELQAFQQTLSGRRGLKVIVERIPVTPMLMMATGGGVPPDQFLKALAAHPRVGVAVLFLALPDLTDAESETLKQSGARIIVVSSLRPGYKRLFERRTLELAIVPRPDSPAPESRAPRTVRERFDQEYSVITAAEAATLP